MNPLTNRWAALFAVAAVLLAVSELVGTGEDGGVLSQVAGSQVASDAPPAPPVEVIGPPPPAVIEDEPTEEVPEEDKPQIISADQAEDGGDFETESDGESDVVAEVSDEPAEDESE